MKVYAVPGRLVRDPATGRELKDSADVPDNDPFWLRRLADGDASDKPPTAEKPKKGAD